MKIHKILNNNFVIVLNESGEEQIVSGKGIAFSKRVGDVIPAENVNKVFSIPEQDANEIAMQYIESLPVEYLDIAINIVDFAKSKIGKQLNENVCFAIADHLYTAVERSKQGQIIPNYLLWELKKFYMTEFEVGLYGLSLVKHQFGIELNEDEAGFIATHIIDGELTESNLDQVYKTTKLIKDISSIVKYYFNVDFDDDSIYHYRFITHLKFFANRLFNDYTFTQNEDNQLYEMIKKSYINSFNCTKKIGEYLKTNYDYTLSKEETVYLTIHIENVIYKAKRNN